MDTPEHRQTGTQPLPATHTSLQAVTFHPSLRQQTRESQNILPIPKGGVQGGVELQSSSFVAKDCLGVPPDREAWGK